ncbi:AAA family ATPase [Desulfolutivibrio sp.]|uniref:AAA family ATPase n=1 Tax=Desulfolutivibrio sp. TaxID=2773296 RepID=UPI002F966580
MSESHNFLRSLSLSGFRAYLHPKTFNFSKKRSLAVFAPNGKGKSSIVDAIEFLLSKDGTLERLGLRAVNNNAGVVALAHNLADEKNIEPAVSFEVVQGAVVESGKRLATAAKRPIPEAIVKLKGCFVTTPIIRGHSLRSFVEVDTPQERYARLAAWLQLDPLVEVQKNIRALRSHVNSAVTDVSPLNHVDDLVAKETVQSVKNWNDVVLLNYVNISILSPLDSKLIMTRISKIDPAYLELEARTEIEEKEVGLAGLRQILKAATSLWENVVNDDDGQMVFSGVILDFETAAVNLESTKAKEAEERKKASASAFAALWKAAEPLFSDGAVPVEACPICNTPIAETAAGSIGEIHTYISQSMAKLADYAKAKNELSKAITATSDARAKLLAALPVLVGLLDDKDAVLKSDIETYQSDVLSWSKGEMPASGKLVASINKLLDRLGQDISKIEEKQGDHTYAKAKVKIDRLIELQAERELALGVKRELEGISRALSEQATMISTEIRKKVESLLDKLQSPINEIYRLIQGDSAVPIRLELPPEDETNQQRLSLVIDFAENRPSVQPSGYLSDSQIHSVALALQLAAIKHFNHDAPIVILDDIVTSYDSDHRRNIAKLLAIYFVGYQVLITTHDERFFCYLKDQLGECGWHFTRITDLDPTYGPRFADHKISDEMIEARWAEGQSAANEMRQAEEEWLLSICRDFGVSVRIRPLDRAYSYERSELASALASFLKDAKLTQPIVPGVANRFLNTLQKGEVENFGSHFQDNPHGCGSLGDEKARWEEFIAFKRSFFCKKCGKSRFKRPSNLKKPVCACGTCEAQLELCIDVVGSASTA